MGSKKIMERGKSRDRKMKKKLFIIISCIVTVVILLAIIITGNQDHAGANVVMIGYYIGIPFMALLCCILLSYHSPAVGFVYMVAIALAGVLIFRGIYGAFNWNVAFFALVPGLLGVFAGRILGREERRRIKDEKLGKPL